MWDILRVLHARRYIDWVIRLVGLPCEEGNPLDFEVFYGAFREAYKQMVSGEPIMCAHTGKSIDTVRPPDALIADVRMYR